MPVSDAATVLIHLHSVDQGEAPLLATFCCSVMKFTDQFDE